MERYIIKIWETKENRNTGESSIVKNNFDNIDLAIEKARKIMIKNNYASLEVQNIKENTTLYFCTPKQEQYFQEEIDKAKIQDKVNKYAQFIYGDDVLDEVEKVIGKTEDVITNLKENAEYSNSPEANLSDDEIEFINETTKQLVEEMENNYTDEDYIRLTENAMAGTLCINDPSNWLLDLELEFLEKNEEMELKDINIKDFVECYFDYNELENLMNYGSDSDSVTMPSISKLYEEILDSINIEYDSIFTDEISDGKYSITVNFNDENSIKLDSRASDTYEQVSSNIESIKDKYLELQNKSSIDEENDMEL